MTTFAKGTQLIEFSTRRLMRFGGSVCGAMLLIIASSSAANADFSSCKSELKADALQRGISATTASAALDNLSPDSKVLELENYQPEFKTPIWDYLAAAVDDQRAEEGRAAMAANAEALEQASKRFQVDKYIIAGIWGVESDFGRSMGSRPLVQSLATLACSNSRRPGFFRNELMATLKIADGGNIALEELQGSWAGAFGQTQFMPSTYLRLAVDLDGTGRDIIKSPAAALGATANYLRKSGWVPGLTWGFEVRLPTLYSGPSGRKNLHSMGFWTEHGVERLDGRPLNGGEAGLFLPAGRAGPAFLVTRNFNAIYAYNAADSYALAVAILAQRLAGGPGVQAAWPTDDSGLSRKQRKELQELLMRRGFDIGSPDGAIGDKTRLAIKSVEEEAGLRVDGRASMKVLNWLRR